MKKIVLIVTGSIICLALIVIIGVGVFIGNFFNKKTKASAGSIEAFYSEKGTYMTEHKIMDGENGTTYIYYYPVDAADKLPVILFGNGSYSDYNTYIELMEHFASHGFLVMDTSNKVTGTGLPIIQTLLVLQEEAKEGNPVLEKADFDRVGLIGHSQGSTGVVNAHTNYDEGSIFKTIISVSLPAPKWCDPEDIYDASKIEIPWLIITGSYDKYISPEESCLEALSDIPDDVNGFFLNALGQGHLEINGDGGMYKGVMTAWFSYYLNGDEKAESLFYGSDAEILNSSGWKTAVSKDAE